MINNGRWAVLATTPQCFCERVWVGTDFSLLKQLSFGAGARHVGPFTGNRSVSPSGKHRNLREGKSLVTVYVQSQRNSLPRQLNCLRSAPKRAFKRARKPMIKSVQLLQFI